MSVNIRVMGERRVKEKRGEYEGGERKLLEYGRQCKGEEREENVGKSGE